MVPLNVDIPADTYERIYAAKGRTRDPIRFLVLKWIEQGLSELGLGNDERLTAMSEPPKKPKKK